MGQTHHHNSRDNRLPGRWIGTGRGQGLHPDPASCLPFKAESGSLALGSTWDFSIPYRCRVARTWFCRRQSHLIEKAPQIDFANVHRPVRIGVEIQIL